MANLGAHASLGLYSDTGQWTTDYEALLSLGDILSPEDLGWLWSIPLPSLTASMGGVVFAAVKVVSSAAGSDRGLQLRLRDGSFEYVLWIGAAQSNLAGGVNVFYPNTKWIDWSLEVKNGMATVRRRGEFICAGAGVASAEVPSLAFGTQGDDNACSAQVDRIRYTPKHW